MSDLDQIDVVLCKRCQHRENQHYFSEGIHGCRARIIKNGTQFAETCRCNGLLVD